MHKVRADMNRLRSEGVKKYTFNDYLHTMGIDRIKFREKSYRLASFAVRGRLNGFIRDMLSDKSNPICRNEESLARLAEQAIKARRVKILRMLFEHANSSNMDIIDGCSDPLVHVYKVS